MSRLFTIFSRIFKVKNREEIQNPEVRGGKLKCLANICTLASDVSGGEKTGIFTSCIWAILIWPFPYAQLPGMPLVRQAKLAVFTTKVK